LKKAINYWSFPGGLEGKKSVLECLQEAKAAGFDGVELALSMEGEVSMTSTKEDMERILTWADEVGVKICSVATGLYWDYNFSSSDKAKVSMAKDITVKLLELASYLKVDTVLVVPGAVDVFFNPASEVVPYDVVYNRCLAAMKELAPVAEKYKVSIGIENVWNKFLLSPLETRNFVDEVGSDYLGVYFDVGNVLRTGYPEHWIRILGNRIKKVHFKDFRLACGTDSGFVDLLEGDVNWPEVMKALRDIGYDDYVVAEMIPHYTYCPEARIVITSHAMDSILSL
jgi:L-ribulose-5-phosphate 3-epimerase